MSTFSGEDEWSIAGDVPEGDLPSPGSDEVLPPRAWRAGDVVDGRFKIVGPLGKGGMGVVYRALELSSGREVALKLLSAQRLQPAQRDRFRREGELTATLSHPGIVRIHSAGEVDGVPYLAYELVSGGRTLGEVLTSKGRSVRRVAALLRDVAQAVGFAHAHGVVHRDLKPENVLLDEGGRPRVADFGLARQEGQARLTNTGAMVGTPAFMAPEQFRPELGAVGPATDVWALGVMLYLALTGERPFAARSLVELAGRVTQSRPVPPEELAPGTPPNLSSVCLKALERDPARRYPTGAELAADLDNALANRAVSASSLGWVRWRQQRRPVFAAALMVLGIAGLISLAYTFDPARRAMHGETRVRALLTDFRKGLRERADLEASLKGDLPGEARAHLHAALAGGRGHSPEEWHERVAHADQAIALTADAALRSRAWRARGRALSALGLHALADESFTRASERSGDADTLLDLGQARLKAGRLDAASSVAERYLIRRPASFDGLELLTRVRLGQGRLEDARAAAERCARTAPGPRSEVLLAEVLAGEGTDPIPYLRRCLRESPGDGGLCRALGEALFLATEVRAAIAILNQAQEPDPAPDLRRCLHGLVQATPTVTPLRDAPASWRLAAGRWLLGEFHREHALLERAADALIVRSPSAFPSSDRRGRRSDALAAVRQLDLDRLAGELALARAILEGPGSPRGREDLLAAEAALPRDPRVLLLSAEARLAVDEPREALAILDALRPSPAIDLQRVHRARGLALVAAERFSEALPVLAQADPLRQSVPLLRARAAAHTRLGDTAAAAAQAERIARLGGSRRAEAETLARMAGPVREERPAWFQRIYDLDPANPTALLQAAKWRFKAGREHHEAALRCLVEAIERDPRLHQVLLSDLFVFAHGTLETSSRSLPEILASLRLGDSVADRMVAAVFSVATVECHRLADWSGPALERVEAVLRADPGRISAYVLRGFLHLRAGRLGLAERDLRIVEEEAPDASIAQFYLGLLACAQGSPEVALQRFERTARLGFAPWRESAWQFQVYPEAEPYKTLEGFERFRAAKSAGR